VIEDVVEELAKAEIGATFNFYREGSNANLRRRRLREYLRSREDAPFLLVGEAPGYRGARVSGVPFTSERQLTGGGPAEATATIVHGVLADLGIEDEVLLWNVVPTHPGTASTNRRPTRVEVDAGLPFVHRVARDRRVIAVGRIAEAALGAPYVRHPSHGGAAGFRAALAQISGFPDAALAARRLPREQCSRLRRHGARPCRLQGALPPA